MEWRNQVAVVTLKPRLEAAKKRLHHNVLAIALPTSSLALLWSVLAHGRGNTIKADRTYRQDATTAPLDRSEILPCRARAARCQRLWRPQGMPRHRQAHSAGSSGLRWRLRSAGSRHRQFATQAIASQMAAANRAKERRHRPSRRAARPWPHRPSSQLKSRYFSMTVRQLGSW